MIVAIVLISLVMMVFWAIALTKVAIHSISRRKPHRRTRNTMMIATVAFTVALITIISFIGKLAFMDFFVILFSQSCSLPRSNDFNWLTRSEFRSKIRSISLLLVCIVILIIVLGEVVLSIW